MSKKDQLEYKFKTCNNGCSNEVMRLSGGGYVSYNSYPSEGIRQFDSDDGGAETALVLDRNFFILNGDFRKEYIKAAERGGVSECNKIFLANEKKHGSSWTSDAKQ